MATGAAGSVGLRSLDARDVGGSGLAARGSVPAVAVGLSLGFAPPTASAVQYPGPSKGNALGAPGAPGNHIPRTDLWFLQTEASKKDIGNEDENVS